MGLSKRERVIRTLELEEPDMVPIHYLGFEKTCSSYQTFRKTEEYSKLYTLIKNSYSRFKNNWVGEITDLRWFNVDSNSMDPFQKKLKNTAVNPPSDRPDAEFMDAMSGRLFKRHPQVETGIMYMWYIDGYFTSPEILHSYWDEIGKPIELINEKTNYSPKVWDEFVESLSPYLYPMANLPIAMLESLYEGMTIAKVAYFMRKKPDFLHEVMSAYTAVNIEFVKRLDEVGVDIIFYADDMGLKGRSIFSIDSLLKFIIPYYKKIFQECKKRSIFVLQHSCGHIDEILPHLVDAGLNGIQALEPAAGVNLARLKENLGDKVAFLGGMDSSNILNFGTPKDVEEDVKRCLREAGKGGGYFVGPSHNILNVPWENCIALRDAMLKHRKYPLNLN
ncbi:MAG: hypothetical protein EU540_08430 [Promethearchaeota archaeon]|nr:MAG: hypothetical protein EU540_08430 [Candidatus Lokiarchaeota archaeon]